LKINNRNKISAIRDAIDNLIFVLESKINFEDEDLSMKAAIKTKKNAFMRAKYLIGKLQRIETDQSKEQEVGWYKETITKLVGAAESAMGELVTAMKEGIDISEKYSTINSDIDTKQEALDHIDDLHKGVYDLEIIIKGIEDGEGVKIIDDGDFKSSFAEDYAYEGFYAKKPRKIQPGYNEKLDAIVISYDGTIGDIIDCYGLRIALPKTPSINSFENSRQKQHLQYWKRPQPPAGLNSDSVIYHLEYIEEEYKRRDEGFWFLNNGVPEYLTGVHYMLLTHLKTDADGGYFHFRKAHRDLLYFLEACWVDDRSLGAILGKTRRTGATYVAAGFDVVKAISSRSANFGLTSKKNIDAKRAFEKITIMFKNMPFFFKPINTGEALSKAIIFKRPSAKTTKNSKEVIYDELDTVMDFEATTEDSYDSMALRFYIMDEASKWQKGNILSHWSKVRKTLLKGSRVFGKAFVLSTVEYYTGADPDEEDAKNGDRFWKLFYDSDPAHRTTNGMTKSGLYKIFISSLDNYEGHIDRFGNCISRTPEEPIEGIDGLPITMGVKEYLDDVWSAYKNNPAKLNDEKRKDPITEADMFRIASDKAFFNTVKIQDQLEHNSNYELEFGHGDYFVGNFRYKDSTQNEVEFHETENGRFMVNWLPNRDIANAAEVRGGKLCPAYPELGCFGIDPYKQDTVSYGSGSKGAIVGYLGNHMHDGIPQDKIFLVYLNRPAMKEIFFEDAIMAMRFYGMPSLIENNIPELLHSMYFRGLTKYAMRRPDKLKLSHDELKYGGIPGTDPNLIHAQAQYLEKHIEDQIGIAGKDDPREQGGMGVMPFNNLLSEFLQFDVNNRTKFDGTVAACLAVYGAQKHAFKRTRNNSGNNASNFYQLYNNKGTISKAIRYEQQHA
jgi:hypothetical protein